MFPLEIIPCTQSNARRCHDTDNCYNPAIGIFTKTAYSSNVGALSLKTLIVVVMINE